MVFKVEEAERIEGIRISPVEVVVTPPPPRVIHNLTLERHWQRVEDVSKCRHRLGICTRVRAWRGTGRDTEAYLRVEGQVRGRRTDRHQEGGCEECFQASGNEPGQHEPLRVTSRSISLYDFHL